MHNSTDVDTVKRAIRAIEIEEYYAAHPVPEREFPELNSLIIGVDIDRELRREKITHRLKQRLDEGMVDEVRRLIEQGNYTGRSHILWSGIQIPDIIRHRQTDL